MHTLASNKIPESNLHAVVLSNILHGLSQYLVKENTYTLLYGTAVNPYYHMEIGKSFIINFVFYMTISLPLKYKKAPFMSLYGLYSYYMLVNMSDYKKASSGYTNIEISHPYMLLSDDQFALLDEDMDRNTIQYDHMHVQTTTLLLFR